MLFVFLISSILIVSCKEQLNEDVASNVALNSFDEDNICFLMKQFLNDFQGNENVDSLFLNKEFVKWDESLYFDFKVNGISWLPKSEPERMQRLLSSDLIDPYPILFLFAFPITDSLFDEADRHYMSAQTQDTQKTFICIDNRIRNTRDEEKKVNNIAITKPLFSRDKQRAAFVVYSDYSYKNNAIHGVVQNVYYVKTSTGWVHTFSTSKWLL
ncbi:MAG: hypothetical protein BGO31_16695 [Bacteroidetes bacterium 43-16]|nr:MAG: hypothetical protein BGO31_16695 [Bacteroidetes bacterium 43-16]